MSVKNGIPNKVHIQYTYSQLENTYVGMLGRHGGSFMALLIERGGERS